MIEVYGEFFLMVLVIEFVNFYLDRNGMASMFVYMYLCINFVYIGLFLLLWFIKSVYVDELFYLFGI